MRKFLAFILVFAMLALSGCQSQPEKEYDEVDIAFDYGYEEGSSRGYDEGYQDGYDYGYEEGYWEGYWVGDEDGRNNGESWMMDNLTEYYYYEHGITFDQDDFYEFMHSD